MAGHRSSLRRATISLRFIIVGGSIAGLASAYALRDAGHEVFILEQSDGKIRSTGGVRSSPNMSRILNSWSAGAALAQAGVKCEEFKLSDGQTGQALGLIKVHEELMRSLGGKVYLIQHGDLYNILFDLAAQAGAKFRFNSSVKRVDPVTATVYLNGGETISGDVVIGADGCQSIVRSTVLGPDPLLGTPDKYTFFTATAPLDLMRNDEDLLPLTFSPTWNIWLGNGRSAHGQPSITRRQYTLTLIMPVRPGSPWREDYSGKYPVDDPHFNFQNFEPRILKILKLARTVTPTSHIVHEAFENWVHESGKVLLIGDAAHPIVPSGLYNVAMALEDAVTLGNLFSRLRHPSQSPLLLFAFEELRQPRCSSAQVSTRQKREFLCMTQGPKQRARDEGMRRSMENALKDWDEADEGYLRATWEDYVDEFGYDANEMVDDWWSKWGNYVERSNKTSTHRSSGSIGRLKT